jgi:hypothetical protein
MTRKKPKLMAIGVVAIAVTILCVLDTGSAFARGNSIYRNGWSRVSEHDALDKAQNQCPPWTHNHVIDHESNGGSETGSDGDAWWSVTVDC